METKKAQRMITTILMTHAQGVGIRVSESRALQNAEQDLHGLMAQVIEECRQEVRQQDFEQHTNDAISITREA